MSKFTFQNILDSLFTNTGVPAKSNKRRRGRTCRIEELEGREMLSATPWTLGDDGFANYEVSCPLPGGNVGDSRLETASAEYHTQPLGEQLPTLPLAPLGDALTPLGAPTVNTLSQTDFNTIRAKYADLGLSANVGDYHVIEIAATELTDANLRNVITTATTNLLNNLIVVHTTDLQNVIALDGQLHINQGNVKIVSLGSKNLTLEAYTSTRVFNIGSAANATLAGLTITGGSVMGNGGGIGNIGSLTMSHCTVTKNFAYGIGGNGGGIYSTGALTLTYCTIAGNSASSSGGGIYSLGAAVLTNCAIVGNTGASQSGGITSGDGGTLTLTNCTIAGNVGDGVGVAGGLYYYGPTAMTMNNSIVSRNYGYDISSNVAIPGYNNFVGSGNLGGLSAMNGNINSSNPDFVKMPTTVDASNTGLNYNPNVWDLRLAEGSHAIDAGSNALAKDAAGNPLTTDLNGGERIVNGTVDMGAYEYAPLCAPPTDLTAIRTSTSIQLSWTAPATGATAYRLEWRNSDTKLGTFWASLKPITATTYTFNNLTPNTTYAFRIYAVNAAGEDSATALTGSFKTLDAPTITEQPQSASYTQGETATALSVTASGSWLTYQWYKDGVKITGATSATYMPSTATVGAAQYYCVVDFLASLVGTAESTTSATATITVTAPPININSAFTVTNTTSTSITVSSSLTALLSATGLTLLQLGEATLAVKYRQAGAHNWTTSSGGFEFDIPNLSGSATIGGLSPNTPYEYQITITRNSAVWVGTGSATTLAAVIQPSVPTITAQPQSAGYTQGATPIALTFSATGNGTLTYQWYRNISDGSSLYKALSGETSTTYTPSTTTVGSRSYYCVVTNTLNGATTTAQSNTATITVTAAGALPDVPAVTAQPQSATYTQGETPIALTFSVTGNGTLTYQWYSIDTTKFGDLGMMIKGATSNEYVPSTTTVGSSRYFCRVTNTLNGTTEKATSDTATITVKAPPTDISSAFTVSNTTQTSITVSSSLTALLSATGLTISQLAAASIEVKYRAAGAHNWTTSSAGFELDIPHLSGGVKIEGLSSNTLYEYQIMITSGSNAWSGTGTATTLAEFVKPRQPTITEQPQSANYTQGDTPIALTFSAIGNGVLTYQWYRNTSDGSSLYKALSGATSNEYVPSTTTVGSRSYYCIVTNTLNGISTTATSNTVTITVTAPGALPDVPAITAQPQSATYTHGDTPIALTFSATGNGTLTYQWYRGTNGGFFAVIKGATSNEYVPSTFTVGSNDYYCVVRNTLNGISTTATSDTATITVAAPPTDISSAFTVSGKTSTSITISSSVAELMAATGLTIPQLLTADIVGKYRVSGTSAWSPISGSFTIGDDFLSGSITIDGLFPSTTYEYQVTITSGSNVWLGTGAATTLAAITPADVPTITEQPQSANYTKDDPAIALVFSATGNGDLTYQWYKVGAKGDSFIFDASLQTYTPSTETVGSSSYYCVVTNKLNGTTATAKSDTVTIVVTEVDAEADVPVITMQPVSANYTQDDPAIALTFSATGNGTLTYQWYTVDAKLDAAIKGATSNEYVPSTFTVGSTSYYCVVRNSLGGTSQTAQSNTVTIVVTAAAELPSVPVVMAQPHSANYTQDDPAIALTFTASGNGTLTYQWYKVGDPVDEMIDGATSTLYTPSTATAGSISYYCVVTNTLDGKSETTQSNIVTIVVTEVGDIPRDAGDVAILIREKLLLADGTEREDVALTWNAAGRLTEIDASSADLTGTLTLTGLDALTFLDCSLTHQLTALDLSGCTALETLFCGENRLRFSTMILPPQSLDTFSLGPQAALPISNLFTFGVPFDELKDEYDIDGEVTTYVWKNVATGAVVVAGITAHGDGTFTFDASLDGMTLTCEMTNNASFGWILKTTNVTIEVPPAAADVPTITAQPQSASYVTGKPAAALFVTATANWTLSYQWYKDGAAITGATLATYTPSTLATAEYYCIVTNTLDVTKTVQSETATITVNAVEETFTVTPGSNSLTISWTIAPPAGAGFQYRLDGGEWIAWKGQAGENITIPGLAAGTYEVRMVDMQGDTIDTKTTAVVPSGAVVSAPLKPKVSVDKKANKPTISTVTLNIAPPKKATPESNVRYVIDIVKAGKVKGRPADFTPFTVTAAYLAQNGNKVLVDGLKPGTSYKFTITAVNANGDSSDGKKKPKNVVVNVTAKTKAYAAPKGIKKTATNASITLTWKDSPFVETNRYEVICYDAKGKIVVYPAGDPNIAVVGTTATISNLEPNTKYKFEIYAVSDFLGGLKSKVAKVSAKTKKI